MLGIRFKIPNKHGRYLDSILKHIGSTNDKWIIVGDEIYDCVGGNLFQKNIYSNQEFKSAIKNNEYYLVFANIQLYSKNDKIYQIEDHHQFIHSNCILIVLITDSEFVEAYAEKEILEIIYQNIINHDFSDIKIVSNPKEIRNYFSVYSD